MRPRTSHGKSPANVTLLSALSRSFSEAAPAFRPIHVLIYHLHGWADGAWRLRRQGNSFTSYAGKFFVINAEAGRVGRRGLNCYLDRRAPNKSIKFTIGNLWHGRQVNKSGCFVWGKFLFFGRKKRHTKAFGVVTVTQHDGKAKSPLGRVKRLQCLRPLKVSSMRNWFVCYEQDQRLCIQSCN